MLKFLINTFDSTVHAPRDTGRICVLNLMTVKVLWK